MKNDIDSKRLLDACLQYYDVQVRAIQRLRSILDRHGETLSLDDVDPWELLPERFIDTPMDQDAVSKFLDEAEAVFRAAIGPDADLNDLRRSIDNAHQLLSDGAYELWTHAASGTDDIESAAREIAWQVAGDIESFLEYGAVHEWLACVPIDGRFRAFPACTDFGGFKIINPLSGTDSDPPTVTRRFREILASHCGVDFVNALVENAFDQRAASIHEQSGGFIPEHPQLVVGLGAGHEPGRRKRLNAEVSALYPLIRLCQLACDVEHGVELQRWPQPLVGYVQMPRVGVAINMCGGAEIWEIETEYVYRLFDEALAEEVEYLLADSAAHEEGTEPVKRRAYRHPFTRLHSPVAHSLRMPGPVFEPTDAGPLDPAEFHQAWQQLGAPLLAMRRQPTLSKLRRAIDNAVLLVSSSVYGIGGSLTLHLVMATEAILSPFGNRSDLSERFALFVAAILGETCDERRKWYKTAKELYGYRCGAVHAADFVPSKSEADANRVQTWTESQTPIARQAWAIFRRCLSTVVEWANERAVASEPCNDRTFQDFYLSRVLR